MGEMLRRNAAQVLRALNNSGVYRSEQYPGGQVPRRYALRNDINEYRRGQECPRHTNYFALAAAALPPESAVLASLIPV